MDDCISEINPEQYLCTSKDSCACSKWKSGSSDNPRREFKGYKNALIKAGNKDFEVLEIPGLNHLFKPLKPEAQKEYEEIEETFLSKSFRDYEKLDKKHQK